MNIGTRDNNLPELFDKLNSHQDIEEEFVSIPKGEKLLFFWKECKQDEVDSASIIEKTRQKIRYNTIKRKRSHFLVVSASIAASVLVCISTIYFLNQKSEKGIRIEFNTIAEQLDNKRLEDVTLITSNEQVKLNNNAYVLYSKDGYVAIDSQEISVEENKDEINYNQLLVPAGKRAKVKLSDGTILTVNSLSKVIYPTSFTGNVRKIYAQGEVFLDVAHDKKHPFIVESNDFSLRVLGTKFNISNYKEMGETTIVLVEGSVEVTDTNENKAKLSPNDLLNITNGAVNGQKKVDVNEYISWMNGILFLNGKDLESITQKLSIYYGVSICCSSVVADKKIYGKLELKENLADVLECIQQLLPVTIENKDAIIYLDK